jgi:hypothetical protein
VLNGWSQNGVETYRVELVTSPDELTQARDELAGGAPTDYVVLRVNENPFGNVNRAYNLRQMIERRMYLARPPEQGEYEALARGRQALLNSRAALNRQIPYPHPCDRRIRPYALPVIRPIFCLGRSWRRERVGRVPRGA